MKSLLANLAFAIPTMAQAQGATTATLLHQLCTPNAMKQDLCTAAKNYPNHPGETCNLALNAVHEGQFLTPSQTLAVADYDSDCEPHANEWGGSVLFKKQGNAYQFVSYYPGIRTGDCIMVNQPNTPHRLVCTMGHTGQGITESTVGEVKFTQTPSGTLQMGYTPLVSATSTDGFYETETVDCTNPKTQYFSLTLPAQKPVTPNVEVEADYADPALIAAACKAPRAPQAEDAMAIPKGLAPLGSVKTGRFLLNLQTHGLTPQPR